jgi:hypothetical protein
MHMEDLMVPKKIQKFLFFNLMINYSNLFGIASLLIVKLSLKEGYKLFN